MEKYEFDGKLFAIVIRSNYEKDGLEFFTPDDYSQQLAYMKHPKGKKIDAHVHNAVKREVVYTKEVLIIKKGKLRVDFYHDDHTYIQSCVIADGDIILLAEGGHGFECLEEVEIIEVKQGPYLGDRDKIRFAGVDSSEVKIV